MKLRIRGNSVRVRLSRREVDRLGRGIKVEQVTEFSTTARLISSIEANADATQVTAQLTDGRIVLTVPAQQLIDWANSDLVSIEGRQPIDGQRFLSILIEKDFECLHSKQEEDADAFPNPRDVAGND